MDDKFIKRATSFNRFNFTEKDFTSLDYKEEIRHLFHTFYFPGTSLENTTTNRVDKNAINSIISTLRQYSKDKYNTLFEYSLGTPAPGEVVLFYIVNGAYLGGGKSAGADLYTPTALYEVKGAVLSSDGYAKNFKVGGTFSLSPIIDQLDDLRAKLKLPGSRSTINTSVLKRMEEVAPERYSVIEQEFGKLLYDNYFSKHDTIFFNNGSASKYGNIESIKAVKANEIKIDVLTSNTIKPKIKL